MSTTRWLILVAALLLAGCGSTTGTPSPAPTATPAPSILPTLTGSFVLKDATKIALNPNGPGCIGTGGYSDVGTGMPVTVKDQAGVIIATSATAFDYITAVCALKFSIPNLPMASFYSIEVGHRGARSRSQQPTLPPLAGTWTSSWGSRGLVAYIDEQQRTAGCY